MPWLNVSQIPKKYKKTFRNKGYSEKQKRAWLKAFNSAIDSGKGEGYAFATAWSVANDLDECYSFREWLGINTTQETS